MSADNERTVVLGLMSYIDENGAHRTAYAGEVVKVLPAQLERFDRLNVLMGTPEPAPEAAEAESNDEGGPSDSWTVPQLQAYAKDNTIDLGDATKKADILAAILSATSAHEEG